MKIPELENITEEQLIAALKIVVEDLERDLLITTEEIKSYEEAITKAKSEKMIKERMVFLLKKEIRDNE